MSAADRKMLILKQIEVQQPLAKRKRRRSTQHVSGYFSQSNHRLPNYTDVLGNK